MDSVSIIVTAHNCAGLITRALHSAEEALGLFHHEHGGPRPIDSEVVVVDDGSTDDTPKEIGAFTAGRAGWKVVRRPQASSPGCARNEGVRQARGSLLFFLDGDDCFLPGHVLACWRALADGGADFAKTGVRLADPVHPDWKERIGNSLVLNLCVRRRCHETVGGYPDYHLFRRDQAGFHPEADLFFKSEDMAYNRLLGRLFRGRAVAAETVEYVRRPGNGYDRQYEKFRRPYGAYQEAVPEKECFRLRLGEVVVQELMGRLERSLGVQAAAPAAVLAEARQRLQAGDHAQAEQLCRRHVEADGQGAEGWRLLGAALMGQGKAGEAATAFRRAVELRPDADAHRGLADALAAQGRRPEAAGHYREALRLRPQDAEAHSRLGVALAEQGLVGEALPHLRRACELRSESAPAHHNLGVALAQHGRPQEAAASLEEALRLQPNYTEACYNLGNVLKGLGRRDEAVARYRQALALRPGYGEACNNLGLALTEAGRPEEAVVLLRHGARLRPQAAEAHNNLGLTLAELGRFGEAEGCYQEALRLDPKYTEAHTNLGSCYKEQGRLEEALASYELALCLEPQAASTRYNRSLALLQAGDYARGWPEYEWRWKRPTMPPRPFKQLRWDGSPLEGRTILLYQEQGLGDTLMFIRYAALLQARGGRVVVECPASLVPLLRTCPGIDQLVLEGEALPDFDVQTPLLSLPGLLGTTLETVPDEIPYLHAERERVEKWQRRLEGVGGFRVGIAWQGNPRFQWDRHRSVPLGRFAPLAAVPGVRLVSLQKGPGADQVQALKGRFEVEELGEGLDAEGAFLDTAAVMRSLDLVVSTDTAVAHLAGALGLPVWVTVARIADWRWLTGRENTPWYPTMRLFRQEAVGDWPAVFARMAEVLAGQVSGPGRGGGVAIKVSPGEIIDRVTILELKSERMTEPMQLAAVKSELAALRPAIAALPKRTEVEALATALKAVNAALWEAEDELRRCEGASRFGAEFVGLARSVYRNNDERAALKRQINERLGSPLVEQKAYTSYA